MKIHLPLSSIAIVGLMASSLSTQQTSAQTGTGVPIPEAPAPAVPTVPNTGTGGPKAVDLDPEIAQAETPKKMDTVPRTDLTIPEIVGGAVDYTTLAGAIRAAGLEESLRAAGPFTLLAPDNDAFAALPEGVLAMLLKPENVELLRKILAYHVIPKKLTTTELVPGDHRSSQGEPLKVVGHAKGEVTIQGARIGISDVMAKNGVIHNVKAVLIPPTMNIEDYSPGKTATGTKTDAAEK